MSKLKKSKTKSRASTKSAESLKAPRSPAMQSQTASKIHSVLHYIVTKAAMTGDVGNTVLSLPLLDLMDPFEGPKFTQDATGTVLKIEIKTSWDEGEDEDLSVEFDDFMDEEG